MTRPYLLLESAIKHDTTSSSFALDISFEIGIFFAFLVQCLKEEENETIAKAKFYHKIKTDCFQAHKIVCDVYATNHELFNWTLVGVHNVLFEPLSSLLHLLSNQEEHSTTGKKLILSISYCLNVNYEKYLSYISVKRCSDYLKRKRKLLKNFLLKEAKDKLDNAENLSFLRDCAVLFGDFILIQKINSSEIQQVEPSNCFEKVVETFQSDIVADGNLYEKARDPPGQRCIYIPPGNNNEESYRLSTFLKYPADSPVNPRQLAASGFYFIGYKDRVKCFSCGFSVENWMTGDDVRSNRWHKNDCKMMRNKDSGNVAMGGLFSRVSIPANERSLASSSSHHQASSHAAYAPSRTHAQVAGQVLMQESGNLSSPRPMQQRPSSPYPELNSPRHDVMQNGIQSNSCISCIPLPLVRFKLSYQKGRNTEDGLLLSEIDLKFNK